MQNNFECDKPFYTIDGRRVAIADRPYMAMDYDIWLSLQGEYITAYIEEINDEGRFWIGAVYERNTGYRVDSNLQVINVSSEDNLVNIHA